MPEHRRLLIESNRLKGTNSPNNLLQLNDNEVHYIKRVLRMRYGDQIAITDGIGHLWDALYHSHNNLALASDESLPCYSEDRSSPLICLAFVVPRRGFDDILRMSCELGIDILQPLYSERSASQFGHKTSRSYGIIKGAVEQSERLWKPTLLDLEKASDWFAFNRSISFCAIATTRKERLSDVSTWLKDMPDNCNEIWIAIGPEGGWTSIEESIAIRSGWKAIDLAN